MNGLPQMFQQNQSEFLPYLHKEQLYKMPSVVIQALSTIPKSKVNRFQKFVHSFIQEAPTSQIQQNILILL